MSIIADEPLLFISTLSILVSPQHSNSNFEIFCWEYIKWFKRWLYIMYPR